MNAVVLLVIAALVFVFGYRYYAKLLAATLFRPADNYSIPGSAPAPAAGRAVDRYVRFGHHFASAGALSTSAGVALAAGWGWTPAFLWIVAASVLVGGVFGFGSIWLLRLPGGTGSVLPRSGRILFWGLTLVLLLATNAVFAWLVAGLLVSFPQAVLPFWLLIPLALTLGRFMTGRELHAAMWGSGVALLLAVLAAWMGGQATVAVAGALQLKFGATPILTLDGTVVWLILLFVYLFYAQRLPSAHFAAPRGLLGALALALLLAVAVIGVLVAHPDLAAPNFHRIEGAPPAWPLLFAVLPGGALAGLYMLVASADGAGRMQQPQDARPLGYGSALADGGLAVLALLACTAAFGSSDAWQHNYQAGAASHDLLRGLGLLIDGLASLIGSLGIDADASRAFIASTFAGLGVVSLDAAIRLQAAALTELTGGRPIVKNNVARPALLLLAILTALGLHASGLGPLGGWAALGAANLVITGLGLILIGVALRRRTRSPLVAWLPAVFLIVVADWALIDRAIVWMQRGQILGVVATCAILLCEVAIAAIAVRARSQT